jgi:hypothetical protein
MQSFHTLGSLHPHRKPPRSPIKEVPESERERPNTIGLKVYAAQAE